MQTHSIQSNLDSQLGALTFLDSVLDHLPDQRVPKVDQRELYAAEKKHRDALIKAVENAAQSASDQYIRHNPEARNLRCINSTFVRKCDPLKRVDLKRYYEHLLNCMLFHGDRLTSMSAIINEVNKYFKDTPQGASIWTRVLPSFQIKKVATMIECSKPELRVKLAGCKTFKDIRQAILNAQCLASDSITFKAAFVISSAKVIINHTSFTIVQDPIKRIRVQVKGSRQWVNLEALISLLQAR